MSCGLIDLPTELQLKIIEQLVQETDTNDKDGDAIEDDQVFKPDINLINWSCASSFFRKLLAPYIFKSVKLRNDDKTGSSLLMLAESPYNELVKELHFVGWTLGYARSEDEAFRAKVPVLPDSVKKILSDLGIFPNLEMLSIEFDHRYNDYNKWDGLRLLDERESEEELKEAEEHIAWRALMAKTYEALIRNEAIELKALEIRQFVRKKVSTFSNPAFRAFLGRLERFSLSIYGQEDGSGWTINVYDYYGSMMSRLDEYFFNHLVSVTALALKAPKVSPLELEGMNHIRLPIGKGKMPLLKELYLEYIFVCPELIEFLLDHRQTLEHISMHNCPSSINRAAGNSIHWKQLFDALADANFERLSHLEITGMTIPCSISGVPLTREEAFGEKEDEEKTPMEVKEARKILQADPNRRLFALFKVDDQYGMLSHDEEENLASFQRGKDQASYERLMRIVNANATKRNQRRRNKLVYR